VAWALVYGLAAYYLGKGVGEFARPFAMALAVMPAVVVISMILLWRRKEQEFAAAAQREIPGPLHAEQSGEADG
jgi:membrane protein DedA with SNARE-associated domain